MKNNTLSSYTIFLLVFIVISVQGYSQSLDTVDKYLTQSNDISSTDPIEGIKFAKKALDLAKIINNLDFKIESLISIANNFDKIDNQQDSVRFYLLLAKNISTKSKNRLLKLKLSHLIADYYFGSMQYYKAKNILVEVLSKNNNYNLKYEAKCNYLLGSIERIFGNKRVAIKLIKKALEQSESADYTKGKINSLLRLGQLYGDIGDYELALDFQHKALKLAIESNNDLIKIKALTRVGTLYKRIKDYSNAIEFLQRAISISDKNEKIPQDGYVQLTLGRIYKNLGDINKALKYYNLANDISKMHNNLRLEMECLSSIGNVYKNRKEFHKALSYYNKAYIIAFDHSFHHEIMIAKQSIGVVNSFLGHQDVAIKQLIDVVEMAEKNKSYRLQESTYEYLSQVYLNNNDYKNAHHYLEMRYVLKDSIFSINTSKKIAEIHSKYEDEVQQRELELLKSENNLSKLKLNSSNKITVLMIALSLFLLVGIAFLLYLVKKKIKINKILNNKNDDINRLNSELKIKNDRLTTSEEHLKSANKTKDKFMSIIAHDLINPNQALKGYAEMLKNDLHVFTESELQEVVENIYNTTDSQQKLLQNLLTWARSQTGRLEYNPKEFNLYELVKETLQPLHHAALQKKIKIKSNINQDIIVYADQLMISTVCRNLVSNAVKFTNQDGTISLSSDQNDERVITTIEDSGIGFDKGIKDNLFSEDSTHSHKGTANESGTGLGLLICKEFVEINGGNIWADSELNRGSKFHFTLPLVS